MTMQGDALKAARLAMNMTQDQLAEALGLTRTFIGLMERDAKPIERRTELALRALLADQRPTDDNLSLAVVLACADRLHGLLDKGASSVTLSREDALMTVGVLDGVAETLASGAS